MKDAFNCGGSGRRSRSFLTIPASVHEAVMALSEEDRHDRAKAGEIDCVRRAALSAPSVVSHRCPGGGDTANPAAAR
jgi:hypothetical protein